MHRLENEKTTEKANHHAEPNVVCLKAKVCFFSKSSYGVAVAITEIGEAQADVREDIFSNRQARD